MYMSPVPNSRASCVLSPDFTFEALGLFTTSAQPEAGAAQAALTFEGVARG